MAEVVLKNIKKSFGSVKVLHDISLKLPDKKLTVFVGPSGCGKSTLLRLIAGLEIPSNGSVYIDKKCVDDLPPAKRNLAMVFQSYALYPHMTVFENMAFGLRLSHYDKKEIKEKVEKVSEILHIQALLNRKPKELSGGQRQRVAIGRALVRNPEVYLFDEPLSNIDATLRVKMRTELAKFKVDLQKTMVYVTHDQVEAMTLADQIVVLNNGKVEQAGSPLTLYNTPKNKFVAQFIGSPQMNFLPAKAISQEKKQTSIQIEDSLTLKLNSDIIPSKKVITEIGIRPEHLSLTTPDKKACLVGTVHVVEHLGSETYIDVQLSSNHSILVRTSGTHTFKLKEKVGIKINQPNIHFFDKKGLAIR